MQVQTTSKPSEHLEPGVFHRCWWRSHHQLKKWTQTQLQMDANVNRQLSWLSVMVKPYERL